MSPSKPIEVTLPREEIQEQIMALSLKDKEILLGWLKAAIKGQKHQMLSEQIPLKKGREVVETLNTGTTVYRLEKVKCGKKKCKCAKGNLHGPYWYSYHWNGKKLSSTYIGKKLNEEIAIALEGPEDSPAVEAAVEAENKPL